MPERPTTAIEPQRGPVLTTAAALFLLGLVLHTADHFRRGIASLTPQVLWAGNVNTVFSLGVIALVFMRHRLAPAAAAVFGFATAFGVAAVHLTPHWSAFSDSLPDGRVDLVTWVAVLVEIAGALALGAAGLYALRMPEPGRRELSGWTAGRTPGR